MKASAYRSLFLSLFTHIHTHRECHSFIQQAPPEYQLCAQQRTGKRIRHSPAASRTGTAATDKGEPTWRIKLTGLYLATARHLPACHLPNTPRRVHPLVNAHLPPHSPKPSTCLLSPQHPTPLTPSDDKALPPAATARTGNAPRPHVVPRSCSHGTFSDSSDSGEPF